MIKTFLIFFGPPGSGKGTQAEMLNQKLKLDYIYPGALFRNEIAKGTKLGKEVSFYVTTGKLVPDKIVNALVTKKLRKNAKRGAIFDGYPRNTKQQEVLLGLFKKMKINGKNNRLTTVLIDVKDQEVIRRITKRRSCACGEVYHLIYNPPRQAGQCDKCGGKLYLRADDKGEVIKVRLKIYHKQVKPLFAFWKKWSKLIIINGQQSPIKVHKELIAKLKKS